MTVSKTVPYVAVLSFVLGVATFVLVASLLRVRVSQAVALSLGGFAMLLVGFPFTRYVSNNQLTFKRWALFSGLGAMTSFLLLTLIRVH